MENIRLYNIRTGHVEKYLKNHVQNMLNQRIFGIVFVSYFNGGASYEDGLRVGENMINEIHNMLINNRYNNVTRLMNNTFNDNEYTHIFYDGWCTNGPNDLERSLVDIRWVCMRSRLLVLWMYDRFGNSVQPYDSHYVREEVNRYSIVDGNRFRTHIILALRNTARVWNIVNNTYEDP